jgi:type I restriction enzyme, S subunit
VPALAEQQRIVRLLDEADELRKLRAHSDRRSVALIPALFNAMFGEATADNTRWPTSALKSMGMVVTGNTPPRANVEFYGSFIDWVKTDNIDAATRRVRRTAEMLSEQGAARGRVVPTGSILITCIAGSRDRIGDAAITDRKVAINQQINAIIPNDTVESAFLCELVMTLKPIIRHRATGVMTGIINKSSLEEIEAIHPPLALQREFAARASEIRALEAEQAASRQRLDELFQSMLHRAFNGEL